MPYIYCCIALEFKLIMTFISSMCLKTFIVQFPIVVIIMFTTALTSSGQDVSSGYKSDLRIFKGALEKMHPDLYRFTSKERFQFVFDSIEQKITQGTNQLEYFRLLSKAESLVREGHTYLQASEDLQEHIRRQELFPFGVLLAGKTIIIKKAYCHDLAAYEGLEIVAINGRGTDEIIKQIAASTGLKSGYNNSALLNILSFKRNFAFAYYYFLDTASSFQIEFQTLKDVLVVQGCLSSSETTFPEFPKEPDPPMSLEIDSASETALIKITTFAHWTVSFSKKDYIKTFSMYFDKIGRAGVKNLIIDVRDNRGGEELLAGELLTYLIDTEFALYKYMKAATLDFEIGLSNGNRIHLSGKNFIKTDTGYFKIKDEVLGKFTPKTKDHFSGKVFVLSNGGSRSATNTLLSLIRTYEVGTIIGQESGGVCGDVDGRKNVDLKLPFSGVRLHFPIWAFKINSVVGDRRRGVIPDDVVNAAGQDLLNNRDVELELANKLIGDMRDGL